VYGNASDVREERDRLWDEICLPIGANTAQARQLTEITSLDSLYEVLPFVTAVRNPLEGFELDDAHLYTRDTAVAHEIDDMLADFDSELPIIPNDLPSGVPADVIEVLSFWVNPLVSRVVGLETVHPVERRIDLRSSDTVWSACTDTQILPIGSNVVNWNTTREVLRCLDTPEDPLQFLGFELNLLLPLEGFEAPVDQEEDLQALADKVVNMVIAWDVAPFLPVWTELNGDELEMVLTSVFSTETVLAETTANVAEGLGIGRIENLTGPVPDAPKIIRPEDVIERLLWKFILPELPIRNSELDEQMSSAVDELDLDSDDLSAEFPEDVARIAYRINYDD
jgi:hypothetical protein